MMVRNQRWWDFASAAFLLGALMSAAARLHATNWTEHLGRLEAVVLLAALLGFMLGKSIFRGRITFLLGLAYSLFFIPWQLGSILPDLEWPARLYTLYSRLWYAMADLLANKAVSDPILFLSAMMLLYWFASILSTYHLVRHGAPWIPLLSLGVMIIVIEYSVEMYRYAKISGAIYSFFYLVFCLLLMGRLYFLHSRKEWEQSGGTVEIEVGNDFGKGVAIAAVALALLAWNGPSLVNIFESDDPSRERVTQAWQDFRDRISKAVHSLRSTEPMIVEGYGNNLFLGAGGSQSTKEVLTVRPAVERQSDAHYYWTARTYDFYQSGQWSTTIAGMQEIGPGKANIRYPSWNARQEVSLTFISHIPLLKTLYYSAEPLNIDHEAQAIVSIAADGATDLNAILMDPPLQGGEEYTVRSTVVRPTVREMREAGEDYPEWLKKRYLQIPKDFSLRITELAQQIAGDEPTAYDKTMAITQYLRRTINYSVTIENPPDNREPLEWFLFDQRAGFCNYYASSEVMMLRSLGVPARLAVGYAQGAWNDDQKAYVVLGKDSHSWPEVYFPGIGWVPFEPTVSQPLGVYPAGDETPDESREREAVGPSEPTFDPLRQAQHAQPFDGGELDQLNQGIKIAPWQIVLFTALVVLGLMTFLEWRRSRKQGLPLPGWLEKTLDEHGLPTPHR
jgi:transglutaminase-like putative cysteine protease